MTRKTDPTEGDEGELGRATGMPFSEVVMPPGWRILVEGEEPVVSFSRAEGEADFGIEAILEHLGPDWYTGVWLANAAAMRGRCEPSRTAAASTVSSRVRRMSSGPWPARQIMRTMSSSTGPRSGCGATGRSRPNSESWTCG